MTDPSLDFVVFSDDWGRHPSSCQHLFAVLSRRHRVLWVNTIGLRAPRADRFTATRAVEKLEQWARPPRRVHENLHVYSPPMLPLAGGALGRANANLTAWQIRRAMWRCGLRRPIVLTSVPTAADYIGKLDERAWLYYVTDDYRLWPGANGRTIAAQDDRLTRTADLVLPVSAALGEGRAAARAVELLPHAVDLEHFARVDEPLPEPADLSGLPHPRFCFFGLIYEKVNLPLLAKLARENPDASVVLIGPVRGDTSALAGLGNMHLLGAKPYADLPRYLRHVDAQLLPYVLDGQITRSAPLKIGECLAVGKPIVAMDVPDLRRHAGLIRLAGDERAFLDECRAVRNNGRVSTEQMRQAVAGQTWAARAEQIEHAIARVAPARGALARRAATDVSACEDAAAWDDYVSRHADGCVWHRRAWADVSREAYGMQCHFLSARRGGRIVGVLPLALQSSRTFGRHLVSLPWLDHAGALADDADARAALLATARNLAARMRADLIARELAPDASAAVRADKVAMTLDLPGSANELWRRFKPKVRNQIRKAERSGLLAERAGPEKLADFWSVYAQNMRDLGSPSHAIRYFYAISRAFSDVFRLYFVRQGTRKVAAALVLADPRQWQVPWASSLRWANSMCPNHLMYWSILADACGATPRFCFGRSSVGSGTYKFKAQWGAAAVPLYWNTWLAPAGKADGQDGAMHLAQQLWRRLPVGLTQVLGPQIIRHVG